MKNLTQKPKNHTNFNDLINLHLLLTAKNSLIQAKTPSSTMIFQPKNKDTTRIKIKDYFITHANEVCIEIYSQNFSIQLNKPLIQIIRNLLIFESNLFNNIQADSKQQIKQLCSCFMPVLKDLNVNFSFTIFDIKLIQNQFHIFNDLTLCLILALCNGEQNSTVEIISYIENNQFTTEIKFQSSNTGQIQMPNKIKSHFSCEKTHNNEMTLKLFMPCENIHF